MSFGLADLSGSSKKCLPSQASVTLLPSLRRGDPSVPLRFGRDDGIRTAGTCFGNRAWRWSENGSPSDVCWYGRPRRAATTRE